ncbi:glycosyltransferase family 1 protein [Collybiopsis luxurians FD-317 M1]|uniref:Glycosyltransferase family 1 protein n=1 Tax=Collybiopsis luxurians FD-317 M1 TaxID=944289 RepID=A0A0D0CD22_9AGAR|nr:glycosyltransferase family 1 protein [Collybiopsis luxurians FD-317 M1]
MSITLLNIDDSALEIYSGFSVIDLTGKNISLGEPVPEFAPAFEALYFSKSVTCKSSGVVIEGLVPPSIVIVDPFSNYIIDTIRSIAGYSCFLFSWMCLPAGAILYRCGPEECGGGGDMSAKIEAEVAHTGKDAAEAAKELFDNMITGKVISLPGVPPMYDYEWYPQEDRESGRW